MASMTSRLALCAAVAATVLLASGVGASAQTYEVTPLVPGSAFHGVYVADVFAYRTVDGTTGEVSEPAHACRRQDAGISDESQRQGRRGDPVELVHRHRAGDRPQDRRDQGNDARFQGAA